MSSRTGEVLQALEQVLHARRDADPANSYVASLYAAGTAAIARKVGEEALELMLAGIGEDDDALVSECADLWFHAMVLLSHRGVPVARVLEELERRAGRSGLDEKAARGRR